MLAEQERLAALNNEWRPTLNEKVDVKPKFFGENSYFVPGEVIEFDKDYVNEKNPKEMKIRVKFFVKGGEAKFIRILISGLKILFTQIQLSKDVVMHSLLDLIASK